MSRFTIYHGLILAFILLNGCAHFHATTPEGFASYPPKKNFRAIHPQQLLYQVHTQPNLENGSHEYWSKVILNRFQGEGYYLLDSLEFQIQSGQKGTLTKWALNSGETERMYTVGIVTTPKKILVIESEGTLKVLESEFPKIQKAIEKIQLK